MATRRVIGTWRSFGDQTRAPVSGTITFRPTVLVRDKNTKHIVVQDPVVVELDSNGSIDILLQVTSDPNLEPEGWQWEVTEQITSRTARRYPLLIPAGTTPFDLSAVEVPPSAVFLDPQSLYLKGIQVGATTVRNPNQPPTVDVTSKDSIATLKFSLPRSANAPSVGVVTEGTPAEGPSVTGSTTVSGDTKFNFRLPRARTIGVDPTIVVNPDQNPDVSTSSTSDGDVIFEFDLPRSPTFTVGTVTTVNSTVPADVTDVGTDGDIVLDFDLPRGADGDGTAFYGQISNQSTQQVTISTAGTFVPMAITGTFDTANSFGTVADGFGIKNNSGFEQLFTVIASADVEIGNNKTAAFRLALNSVGISQSECRATTGTANFAKLLSQWTIAVPAGQTVSCQLANITDTTDIDVNRAKIVLFTPGRQGEQGDAATINVGTVSTVNPDVAPDVTNSGTTGAAVLDFDLPRAAVVTVDTPAAVLNPDQNPTVSSTTTDGDVEVAFSLPRAPAVTLGTVTPVNPDVSPTITDSGVDGDVVLDVNIPRAASVTLGTVTPVNPDVAPDVTDSGTDGDVVLDIDLPRAPTFTVGTITPVNPDVAPTVADVGLDGDVVLDFDLPRGPTFTVGTVTTVPSGTGSTITDVGLNGDIELDFVLEAGPPPTSIDDLGDVTITSAVDGQVLVYDTGDWVNEDPFDAGLVPTAAGILVVDHGSDDTEPRPIVAAVYWRGDVPPTNAANGDLWYDTIGD
jgi:hypothetical protein